MLKAKIGLQRADIKWRFRRMQYTVIITTSLNIRYGISCTLLTIRIENFPFSKRLYGVAIEAILDWTLVEQAARKVTLEWTLVMLTVAKVTLHGRWSCWQWRRWRYMDAGHAGGGEGDATWTLVTLTVAKVTLQDAGHADSGEGDTTWKLVTLTVAKVTLHGRWSRHPQWLWQLEFNDEVHRVQLAEGKT
jgi:hypothetical protein